MFRKDCSPSATGRTRESWISSWSLEGQTGIDWGNSTINTRILKTKSWQETSALNLSSDMVKFEEGGNSFWHCIPSLVVFQVGEKRTHCGQDFPIRDLRFHRGFDELNPIVKPGFVFLQPDPAQLLINLGELKPTKNPQFMWKEPCGYSVHHLLRNFARAPQTLEGNGPSRPHDLDQEWLLLQPPP